MAVADRLTELGLVLPAVAAPAGAYVPAIATGELVFTAGQLPFIDGTLARTGLLGADVEVQEAADLAAVAALNALAAIADLLGGLDRVVRIVKVTGFVASAPGFTQQPAVINGASNLLVDVFGEHGKHARSAVGVAALPMGSPVEVELIAQFR